jgi:hypothetical protein
MLETSPDQLELSHTYSQLREYSYRALAFLDRFGNQLRLDVSMRRDVHT